MVQIKVDVKQTLTIAEYQERLMDEAARDMSRHIDESILMDALVEGGWTKVDFYFYSNEQAVDMKDWCRENCTNNQWKHLAGAFIFRKKKEAEWFMLRWL